VTDLIDTTEMYLKTVYELVEEGIVPMRARIAERLGHSGPTVSQTVARMERDGLIVVTGDRHLELTPEGNDKAMRVVRKHRLAERLLTDVVGLEWAYVHDEACRWEHVMSEQVERRLVEILDHPQRSPYGIPIPGLDELGEAGAGGYLDGVVAVTADARLDDGAQEAAVRHVARIGELLQTDAELLEELRVAGLVPGAEIEVLRDGDSFTLTARGSQSGVTLSRELARHVFVVA